MTGLKSIECTCTGGGFCTKQILLFCFFFRSKSFFLGPSFLVTLLFFSLIFFSRLRIKFQKSGREIFERRVAVRRRPPFARRNGRAQEREKIIKAERKYKNVNNIRFYITYLCVYEMLCKEKKNVQRDLWIIHTRYILTALFIIGRRPNYYYNTTETVVFAKSICQWFFKNFSFPVPHLVKRQKL